MLARLANPHRIKAAHRRRRRVASSVRLPGQYFDAETGLNYNYFRDYEPGTGRYVESDPISIHGGVNTYSYVQQNPLRTKDDYGLFGIIGCDYEQMSELIDAEFQIEKMLNDSNCGCGANSGCIPCKYKQDLLDRLRNSEISCSAHEHSITKYTPWLWPHGYCGDAPVNSYQATIYPVGFHYCGCVKGVVLHELLHDVGLTESQHPEIDFIDHRCFNCSPVHPEYGGYSPPSDGY